MIRGQPKANMEKLLEQYQLAQRSLAIAKKAMSEAATNYDRGLAFYIDKQRELSESGQPTKDQQ